MYFTGLSAGLYCSQQITLLALFFKKRRGLAMGLQFTAQSIGATLWPVFVQYLFIQYSWQGTLLLILGLRLHTLVTVVLIPAKCGISLLNANINKTTKPSSELQSPNFGNKEENVRQDSDAVQPKEEPIVGNKEHYNLKDRTLLLHLLGMTLNFFGLVSVYTYIPSLAIEFGLSQLQASILVSCVSVFCIFGRPLVGFLSDYPRCAVRKRMILGFFYILSGTTLVLSQWCTTFWLMIVDVLALSTAHSK